MRIIKRKIFDNSFIQGIGVLVAIDTIFYFFGFEEDKLVIITFILALVITIYCFDKRIRRLERRLENE